MGISRSDMEMYRNEHEEIADAPEQLDVDEDVEDKKPLPTPVLPSRADIDRHWLDHLPFRSWCNICVNGRGRERPHHRHPGVRTLPTLCFDYMFVSKKGVFTRDEWKLESAEAEGVKVLVAREAVSKCVFAHAIPMKGVDPDRYSVDCLVKDIEWMGCTRVIMKSDNEPSIVKLLLESLKSLRIEGLDQAAEEHSPQYDPQ